MDRVLVVCGAGASSTFVALKLRREARARGLELIVEAGALPDLDEHLPLTRILLVGPHLGARFDELTERAAETGAAAALLPDTVFGPGGARIVTDLVVELLAAPPRTTAPIAAEQTTGD